PREPDPLDDGAVLNQLPNAVAERHIVYRNERPAAAREANVAELDAPNKRSFEAADFERRGEILIGLTDNQLANPILRPARLDDGQRGAHDDENDRREVNDRFAQDDENAAEVSWKAHRPGTKNVINVPAPGVSPSWLRWIGADGGRDYGIRKRSDITK